MCASFVSDTIYSLAKMNQNMKMTNYEQNLFTTTNFILSTYVSRVF